MKTFICFWVLLIVLSVSAFAQEFIIKQSGDTIYCRITSISSTKIYFDRIANNEVIKDRIKLEEVKSYWNVLNEKEKGTKEQNSISFPFRWAINGGYLYRFGEQDLANELKKGIALQMDLHVYEKRKIASGEKVVPGYGLQIDYNYSSNTIDEWFSNMNNLFVGPSLLLTVKMTEATYLNFSIAPGLMSYWEMAKYEDEEISFYSGNLALDLGGYFDFYTTENFGFGIGFNVNFATVKSGKIVADGHTTDFDLEESMNLARYAITVGIRFK